MGYNGIIHPIPPAERKAAPVRAASACQAIDSAESTAHKSDLSRYSAAFSLGGGQTRATSEFEGSRSLMKRSVTTHCTDQTVSASEA